MEKTVIQQLPSVSIFAGKALNSRSVRQNRNPWLQAQTTPAYPVVAMRSSTPDSPHFQPQPIT